MSWSVIWDDEALKELARPDRRTQQRIVRAIDRLAAEDYGDVKRLRGQSGDLRLRVGSWRVRFIFEREVHSVRILHVLPRGDAYP